MKKYGALKIQFNKKKFNITEVKKKYISIYVKISVRILQFY